MRLEFIDRIKENDVLGKNIYTSDGNILLRAGIMLSNRYIYRLKNLGIFYLYVEDDRLEDIDVEDKKVNELKKVAMKNMDKIFRNVQSGNKLNVRESVKRVEELIEYIISSGDINKSLSGIRTYDNYTYVHCIDTGIMATFLGLNLKLKGIGLVNLGIGATLHDIGKLKVNKNITGKVGNLTESEFNEMKNHPIYGRELLDRNMSISETSIEIVAQHHERVDGRGYPYKLKGNEISMYAKIVAVCDVYDAVSNDRCYRKRFKPNDAYELILSGSGTAFDRDIIKKFKKTFSIYPLGSCVRLSNGVEAYVIRQNQNFPDRPVVRVLYDIHTRRGIPFYEIDLIKDINITIIAIV